MKRTIKEKWVFASLAVTLAVVMPTCAEEELVRLGEDIAMPKSMNVKVGCEGDIPCIALQVPHSKGGYVSVSCGASHKVANEDAITKLQEASAGLGDKLARFRVGNATFYGFYCKDCGGYEGHAVAMGGFLALYVFPPKSRSLDAEALEILKKLVFIPQKGFGIESAIKLYGPRSPMKASAKFPVLKKMVEARPESVELIDLLRDVAQEAGETTAAAWCEAELKRLDPEVYGTPTTSIPMPDFTCEQGNKITGGVAIYQKFVKKTITIPTSGGGADVAAAPSGRAVAPQPVEVAPQPKVAVKPGPGESEYKGRKWRYEINRSCTNVWLRKNPLDDYSGVLEFPPTLGGLPLKTIDRELFKERKEMKGVVLPEGIEKIEDKTFEDCEGISQLVLPDSLETIEEYAFSGCSGIGKLILPKRLKTLGEDAFKGCWNLEGDFDLRNLEVLGRDAFNGCAKLHSVTLPDGIGEIGIATFESCSNLVMVTIPKSVGRIDSSAFRNCVSFKGVLDIPAGVTNIDRYAFASCTGLTGVNLPSGLVKLGDSAFMDCTALESLALPEGLKYVGEQLVKRCTSLKEVSIPSSVKRVGASAFNGCTALKGVTLPQGLEKLENWAFQESGIESIDIPGGVKQIDPYAFASCASLKSVALHEGLKTIRKGVFKGCTALEEITIPASVESIEVEAFEGCAKLKKVVFLGKKPKIARGTFKGCTGDVEKLEPQPPRLPKGYGSVKMKTKTVTLPGGAAMEMIYCPPGTYMMGTPEGMKKASSDDTKHPIKVTLTKGFWLGKYEVTQKQWQSVMGELSDNTVVKGDDFPAHGISWVKADAFCKKVGGKARLPTEGEWEYACRAGAPTAFPWGNTANGTQLACDGTRPFSYEEDEDKIPKGAKHDKPVKVGSYRPNAWGFHDMNGNVIEWCSDWHMMYWEKTTELTDPRGEDEKHESRHKVMRGGAWDLGAWACTNSSRFDEDKENRACTRGFRMAMDE